MEFKQLQYFLKICETGSISRASKELYISPQALSKSMEKLEESLDAPLFVKNGKGLALSSYGQILYHQGRNLLRQKDALVQTIKDQKNQNRQVLTIAFYSGMFRQYPDGFLTDFMEEYPKTTFRFFSYYDNDHSRNWTNNDVDLFFSSDPLPYTNMELIAQFHRPLYLIMGSEHPLASHPGVALAELKDYYLISINSDFTNRTKVNDALQDNGVEISAYLSDADQDITDYLMKNQQAVSFFAGPERMLPPGIIRKKILDENLIFSIYIYGRTGLSSEAASAFLQKIRDFQHS
ncbi:MAG: LysR family transcriptional regulator [Eubacteriales bacterium]|nr:LysR family transcriptional regulator [Eubacteriales bacterium]